VAFLAALSAVSPQLVCLHGDKIVDCVMRSRTTPNSTPKFDVAAVSVDKRVDPGLGLGFKTWIVTLILGGLGSIFFGIEFIPW
jgi:hypothetical protein